MERGEEEFACIHCRFFEIVFVPILFLSSVISLCFLFLFFQDLLFFSKKFYRVGTIVEEVLLNANLVQQPTNKKG